MTSSDIDTPFIWLWRDKINPLLLSGHAIGIKPVHHIYSYDPHFDAYLLKEPSNSNFVFMNSQQVYDQMGMLIDKYPWGTLELDGGCWMRNGAIYFNVPIARCASCPGPDLFNSWKRNCGCMDR